MLKVSIAHFEQMQHNNQQKTLYNTTPLGNVPTFNKYFPTEYGRFSSQHCFIVYGITHFKDKPKLIFQGRRHRKGRGGEGRQGGGGEQKGGKKKKKEKASKQKRLNDLKAVTKVNMLLFQPFLSVNVTVLAILVRQLWQSAIFFSLPSLLFFEIHFADPVFYDHHMKWIIVIHKVVFGVWTSYSYAFYPAANYMFKVNHGNTRTRCEICSKLTIKTSGRRQWDGSGAFIFNFEHISHLVLVFLLLTLSR